MAKKMFKNLDDGYINVDGLQRAPDEEFEIDVNDRNKQEITVLKFHKYIEEVKK